MSNTQQLTGVLEEFGLWRTGVINNSAFECVPISFSESNEWRFVDGALRHHSGGFFSIVGLHSTSRHPALDGQQRIIILQPQIAINGYLVRRGDDGSEILCQGRVEPGNVSVMQLAPTVQSTEANIKRLHGGAAPPLVSWFTGDHPVHTIVDGLQSEEGSRYHGKYNRNVVLEIPADDIELPTNFRWFRLSELREFVVSSNIFNTDSRSVLSCMDWDWLVGDDGPFSDAEPGGFAESLRRSYRATRQDADFVDIVTWLTRLRVHAALRSNIVPIDQVKNWQIHDGEIREVQDQLGFCVRQYRIQARGREVSGWDQPLIDSAGVGRVTLACQERNGLLRFLLQADYQVGYLEGVQLSSSLCTAPGESINDNDPVQGQLVERIDTGNDVIVHASCRQSEEGGRFYQDENDYQIVELDPRIELPESDNYRWATLAQIRELLTIPGMAAIELRNALSMLLHFS